MDNVTLKVRSATLAAVTVTAQKPLLEYHADRTVVNVEASALAAGGSAMEILEKLPGLSVDKDGNISIKGRKGIYVLIDDRPAYLSGADLAAYLRNMQASQLDQIEIMTNPPAKYDAAGNGVINIRTKKSKVKGFNGSVAVAYMQGTYPGTTQSVTFNYRGQKVNIFGNLGYSYKEGFQNYYILRKFRGASDDKVISIYDQHTYTKTLNKSATGRVGVDYYASKKTTLGFVVSGFDNPSDNNTSNTTLLKAPDGTLNTFVIAPATLKGKWDNLSANVNLKHSFDSSHRELLLNLDYVLYNTTSLQNFTNRYYNPDSTQAIPPALFRADLPGRIRIYSAKADYSHPFSPKSKLEAGLKSSYVTTDNNAEYFNASPGSSWVKNDSLSNHFLYRENVNAGYLTLTHKLGRLELQAGLRGEYTWLKGEQLNGDQSFTGNYFKLFPSANLTYVLDKDSKVIFNYGRRIERPDYRSLNPFRFYLDQYTYQQGNPSLKPQYSQNFDLNYVFMDGVLTASLLYNRTTDVIQDILLQDPARNQTFEIPANLSTRKIMGASISADLPFNDNLETALYLEYNNNDFKGAINNGPFALQTNTFSGQVSQQVKLKAGWSAQIIGVWTTRNIDGTFLLKPQGSLNAAIRKKVLHDQGTITLSGMDIFKWVRFAGNSRYQNIDVYADTRLQTQQLKLAFTWRFSKGAKVETSDHKTGTETETNRVKTERK